MADYKSLFNPGGLRQPRNPQEEVTDENNFALSPLISRPWDVPDLPERTLTQDQINTVLGLVNPKPEPVWGPLMSTGAPVDFSTKASVSTSSSSKGGTPVDTIMETGAVPTKLDFTDKEMQDALDAQRSGLIGNQIIRSGVQMGRAIAGTESNAPILPGMDELASLGVSQLQTARKAQYDKFTKEKEMADKMEAADPNSQHSVSYRNLAKSMLDMQGLSNISKAIDGLSAEQIDKKFPMISNIVTAKMAQDTKRETANMMKASKEDMKIQKDELRHQDWLTNQLEKELKSKQFESINKLMQSSRNIDDALVNPSGIKDIGTLYNFIKSIDENSAVREGEVKLGREALTAMQNAKMWMSNFSDKKRLLPPNIIQDIRTLNEAAKKASTDTYMKRINYVRNQGLDRGISPERLDRSLGTMVPEVNEIRKQQGKTLVKKQYSPSANKTKFIYSDGTEEIKDGKQ